MGKKKMDEYEIIIKKSEPAIAAAVLATIAREKDKRIAELREERDRLAKERIMEAISARPGGDHGRD